jgi:hypothetical protein
LLIIIILLIVQTLFLASLGDFYQKKKMAIIFLERLSWNHFFFGLRNNFA